MSGTTGAARGRQEDPNPFNQEHEDMDDIASPVSDDRSQSVRMQSMSSPREQPYYCDDKEVAAMPTTRPRSHIQPPAIHRTPSDVSLPAADNESVVVMQKGDYKPYQEYDAHDPIGIPPPRGALWHFKAWSPEAAWCLLSLLVFISLVIVLAEYEGRPMPVWPLGLTLNTIVALLATLCRFMTFLPVAEGISQLKWIWFTRERRPLQDLYSFDQASRGPWGALLLITRLRGSFISMGTMASFVMVSGLVTSFLTQSAVSYSTRLVAEQSDTVFAQAARSYPYGMIESGLSQQDVIDGISRAAFQATFYTVDQTWPQLEPRCPSADCHWPLFSSLAVCASLGNVTEHLVITEETPDARASRGKTFNATLPRGLGYLTEEWADDRPRRQVNMTSPIVPQEADFPDITIPMNVTDMEDLLDVPGIRSTFPDERDTLFDWGNPDIVLSTFSQFTFIYNVENTDPDDKDHRFRAVEVLWHFCVNEYNTSVSEGVTTTETVQTTVQIDTIHTIPQAPINSFTLSSAAGGEGEKGAGETTFNVSSAWAYDRLDWDFREVLSGAWSDMYAVGRYTEFNYQWGTNLFRGVDRNMTVGETDERMWKNLEALTGTIADGMTAYMRTHEANGLVMGESLTAEAFVVIRWQWLAFLASQIGLTFLFLLIVIIHTAHLNIDIVKSSNIAELFALRRQEREEAAATGPAMGSLGGQHSPGWMAFQPNLDKEIRGKLTMDRGGWNFGLQRREAEGEPAPR